MSNMLNKLRYPRTHEVTTFSGPIEVPGNTLYLLSKNSGTFNGQRIARIDRMRKTDQIIIWTTDGKASILKETYKDMF